jgi:hypothetical protein
LWLSRNIPRKFSVHYAEFWPKLAPSYVPLGPNKPGTRSFQFGGDVRTGFTPAKVLLIRRMATAVRLIAASRRSFKYLSNLGWCFSTNVITAAFKLSDRRPF